MIARVALLALALLAPGCRFQAHIDSRPSDESCSPGPATHAMRCPEFKDELPVRMDGGKVCDPRGGEIIMKFVKGCVLVPSYCWPAEATHSMQCPGVPVVDVRLDRGVICSPLGGEIDDRDAGCLFYETEK